MSYKRDSIYKAIDSERDFQDDFIQDKGLNPHKSIGEFLTLIRHYSSRADSSWCRAEDNQKTLDEIRKVAALCVACMENHGSRPNTLKIANNINNKIPAATAYVSNVSWTPVTSSNINSVRYDSYLARLEVKFNDGRIYSYDRVDPATYLGFLSSPSKGSYLNNNIKGRFQSNRIF